MNRRLIYYRAIFSCALLFFFNENCSKEHKAMHNIYMKAEIKPLTLLCFEREDLESVIKDPRKLGFLANDGKCFLQEKSLKVRIIERADASAENKLYKLHLETLKKQAYIHREQLNFTEIWKRIFIPKERFVSKCKTNKECEEILTQLQEEEEQKGDP